MAIEIAKAERNPTVALCFPMLAPLLSPAGQFCITGTLWCYLEAPLEGIWEPGSTPSCWQALGGHSASRINCGCFLLPRAEPASVVFLVLSQNHRIDELEGISKSPSPSPAVGWVHLTSSECPGPHPWPCEPPGMEHPQLWAEMPRPHCPLSKEFPPNI